MEIYIPEKNLQLRVKKSAKFISADPLAERARLEEERRLSTIPAWKRQLLDKKGDEAKR